MEKNGRARTPFRSEAPGYEERTLRHAIGKQRAASNPRTSATAVRRPVTAQEELQNKRAERHLMQQRRVVKLQGQRLKCWITPDAAVSDPSAGFDEDTVRLDSTLDLSSVDLVGGSQQERLDSTLDLRSVDLLGASQQDADAVADHAVLVRRNMAVAEKTRSGGVGAFGTDSCPPSVSKTESLALATCGSSELAVENPLHLPEAVSFVSSSFGGTFSPLSGATVSSEASVDPKGTIETRYCDKQAHCEQHRASSKKRSAKVPPVLAAAVEIGRRRATIEGRSGAESGEDGVSGVHAISQGVQTTAGDERLKLGIGAALCCKSKAEACCDQSFPEHECMSTIGQAMGTPRLCSLQDEDARDASRLCKSEVVDHSTVRGGWHVRDLQKPLKGPSRAVEDSPQVFESVLLTPRRRKSSNVGHSVGSANAADALDQARKLFAEMLTPPGTPRSGVRADPTGRRDRVVERRASECVRERSASPLVIQQSRQLRAAVSAEERSGCDKVREANPIGHLREAKQLLKCLFTPPSTPRTGAGSQPHCTDFHMQETTGRADVGTGARMLEPINGSWPFLPPRRSCAEA